MITTSHPGLSEVQTFIISISSLHILTRNKMQNETATMTRCEKCEDLLIVFGAGFVAKLPDALDARKRGKSLANFVLPQPQLTNNWLWWIFIVFNLSLCYLLISRQGQWKLFVITFAIQVIFAAVWMALRFAWRVYRKFIVPGASKGKNRLKWTSKAARFWIVKCKVASVLSPCSLDCRPRCGLWKFNFAEFLISKS